MQYYPRKAEELLNKWLGKKVVVVKGPRQSGKTTLMKHMHEKKGGTYLDLTLYRDRKIALQMPYGNQKQPIFLDEVGYVDRIGPIIKYMYDHNRNAIVVSGSGAFDVKANIGKYLVGRSVNIELLPLSFEEFVMWRDKLFYKSYIKRRVEFWNNFRESNEFYADKDEYLDMLFKEYMEWGGYPGVVLSEEKEAELSSVVENQLDKDVFMYFDIREKEKFREMLVRMVLNTSSIFNVSSLNISHNTAWKYLSILSMEYILLLLPPFFTNPTKELKKSKKVYFYDTGYANYVSGFRLDEGRLLENAVLIQLIHRFRKENIKFWASHYGGEVDFVILDRGKPLTAVEVKTGKKRHRSLWSFMNKYGVKKGILISKESDCIKKGDKKVYLVPPYWL